AFAGGAVAPQRDQHLAPAREGRQRHALLAGVGAQPRVEAHGAALTREPPRQRQRRPPHAGPPGVSQDPDAAHSIGHAYWRWVTRIQSSVRLAIPGPSRPTFW